MTILGFITIGSIVAMILAFLSAKIRQLILYGLSRFIFIFMRKTYLHKSLGNAFIIHLTNMGYKVKRFAGELYGEDPAYIRSEKEVKHILYRDFYNNTQLFWKWSKGWPILITGTPLTTVRDRVYHYSYIVYSFRWATDLVGLLDAATERKNEPDDAEVEENNFFVKRVSGGRFFKEQNKKGLMPVGEGDEPNPNMERSLADPFSAVVPIKWEKNNIGELVYHNTLQTMSLNEELEDLVDEIKFWASSFEWYEERNIPWKRGIALAGSPGTGKTMFARAIAEELNMPLITFDLASMDNVEFVSAYSEIAPRRVVLFEDFDNIFHGRKNILNNELSFDIILNILDGVQKKQGILFILTTNHPELLDPALGGASEKGGIAPRPGRIDRIVFFNHLDDKGKFKLAMRILKNEELAHRIVADSKGLSAAQVQEKSIRLALDVLFKNRKEVAAKKDPSHFIH